VFQTFWMSRLSVCPEKLLKHVGQLWSSVSLTSATKSWLGGIPGLPRCMAGEITNDGVEGLPHTSLKMQPSYKRLAIQYLLKNTTWWRRMYCSTGNYYQLLGVTVTRILSSMMGEIIVGTPLTSGEAITYETWEE
jgi:hypothetical protein